MNKLWEDPPYGDLDEYKRLCLNSTPSDFFFCAQETEMGGSYIALVPKVYFLKEKYMWDQSMPLDHILPSDFSEAMESVWESDRSVSDLKKDLLGRGFEENEQFSKLVAEDYE